MHWWSKETSISDLEAWTESNSRQKHVALRSRLITSGYDAVATKCKQSKVYSSVTKKQYDGRMEISTIQILAELTAFMATDCHKLSIMCFEKL